MKDPDNAFNSLVDEYRKIGKKHRELDIKRTAMVTLAPSVIRVFNQGTRSGLIECLKDIPIEEMREIKTEQSFKIFYCKQLDRVVKVVEKSNLKNLRLGRGLMWGHCTKVLSIYLYELVLRTRLFSTAQVKVLTPLLYVPLDSILLKRLRNCGMTNLPQKIKALSKKRQFWEIQDFLKKAAKKAGIPAIYFNDVWADRVN